MSVELTMLVWSVVLLFVILIVQSLIGIGAQGLAVMAGNRDDMGPPSVLQARAKRVVDNHVEGLMLFAPLVLVAAHQNISTPSTVLGAQLFFYARVAHAVIYFAGLGWIRPLAWAVGIVGTAMILLAVLNPA